jgi:hypothetical protein
VGLRLPGHLLLAEGPVALHEEDVEQVVAGAGYGQFRHEHSVRNGTGGDGRLSRTGLS